MIGSVNTTLRRQYGDVYVKSNAFKYVSDIAFAGTVVGQLVFGFLADHWSRTNTLMVSTVILIIFTALAAGSYWHGEPVGMFNMLTAWRFFVGIGIGGRLNCLNCEKEMCADCPRRIPSRQRRMRRVQWSNEERHQKQVVHSFHKLDDRLWLCHWCLCSLLVF